MPESSLNDPPEKGPRTPLSIEDAQRLVAEAEAHTVVLVEGWSDQAAVETLARRAGLDLQALGVAVLPIGGATNVRRFAACFGAAGLGLRLAGLYDLPEERHFLRAIRESVDATTSSFHACREDLEDELLRAIGPEGAEQVIAAEGEMDAFRSFQAQPAQRGRSLHAQLRRFMGTKARRKIRYGTLLAEAVDLNNIPGPLSQLLLHLSAHGRA